MAQRFVFAEDGSSKFWEIDVAGSEVTVRFGRLGTQGQAKTKSHGSEELAQKDAQKLIAEKTKKGYREEAVEAPTRPTEASNVAAEPTPASPKPKAQRAETAPASPASPASPAPASVPGETLTIANEIVRFSAPSWVSSLADKSLADKLPRKKGLPFEKVWEGLAVASRQWVSERPSVRWVTREPRTDALAERVREHLARGPTEGSFDRELEAATFALSTMLHPGTEDWLTRPSKAFWHWVDRAGPEEAMRTFMLALRFGIELSDAGGRRTFSLLLPDENPSPSRHRKDTAVVRDALRAFGAPVLGAIVRDGFRDEDVTVAGLLDDEVGARKLYAEADPSERPHLVTLAPLFDDPAIASELFATMWGDGAMLRVVLRHGIRVAEAVFARAPKDLDSTRRWIPILACYPSVLAARLLVPLLERKADRKLVGDALANMPSEALVALREAQGKRSKFKDAIDALVATLGASAAHAHDTSAAASAGASAGAAKGPSHEAPLEALPTVLRAPPWRAKKRASVPVVEGLVAPKVETVIQLLDPAESARRWIETASQRHGYSSEGVRTKLETGGSERAETLLSMPLVDIEALRQQGLLSKLDAQYWEPQSYYLPGLDVLLHAHGVAIVPSLLAIASGLKPKLASGLCVVGDTGMAEVACGWLGSKGARKAAYVWVRKFPEHAAAGLLPLALGSASTLRDRASLLLHHLDTSQPNHRAMILAVARELGAEAQAATEALLARDPLEQCPTKAPKLPESVAQGALPELLLRDGRAVSAEARMAFFEMLAFSPLEPPYAGIADVKAACDPRSLDELSCALVRAWVAAGMASAHEWMVRQVALVGTDVAARFLYDRGRAWAQESSKQRAILALDVLGAMGSDLSLSLVGRVSRSGQRQYMKDRALEILAEVAEARGLTADELEDRTAPDLGLDDDGTLRLDFGPRAYRVGFDEHLSPFVQDETGARLPSLPRATKTDDAAKAKAASEAWKALKSEAEKVSSDQIARFLRMMADERHITADVFVSAFVAHPLVGHLVRRLVWGTYASDGALVSTFRVAEDRSLATVDDTPFELPKDARVGVVHPHQVAASDRTLLAKWGERLADYELIAPFPQLSRDLTTLGSASEISARYSGKKAPSALLYGLRRHGFRARADEYGITAFTREVAGLHVTLNVEPALRSGVDEPHTISVWTQSTEGAAGPTSIQLSELVHQIDQVIV